MNDETISFAMACKEEMAQAEREPQGVRALLAGFIKGNGSLRIGPVEELELSTESSVIAKMLYSTLTRTYDAQCRFAYTREMRLRKKTRYHVLVENPESILEDLGVDFFSSSVPAWVKSEEERRAYLAGAFMCSGSVNSPVSSNYHLEIATEDGAYAKKICQRWHRIDGSYNAKIAERRKTHVVYLKRSEEISDFLAACSAQQCCLKFEDFRVGRDFLNVGNRLINLDAANMTKINKSAEQQIKEITYFENKGETFFSNPKLHILVGLRMKNPDASLKELASKLSEELATTITKSNVNHLFRYLHSRYLEENPDEE